VPNNTIVGIWPTCKKEIEGEGIGVFGSTPHGRVTTNLGFNKPLRFDNQTFFAFF
jgi:hypothetical protein